MNSGEEYLKRTESAVIKIFEGIESYIQILRNSKPPIYVGNAGDTLNRRPAYENWIAANQVGIQASLKAQRDFSAESFALATLCGSLLQIAAMGIQWFSENEEIPENLPKSLYSLLKPKSKITKFCVGRRVRSVPIGLIIYAGRNQFNHMDDDELREPNVTIFDLLAKNYTGTTEQSLEYLTSVESKALSVEQEEDITKQIPKDPAFDLENGILINFASNITGLLEWRDYESYYSDMYALIVVV
jgi:hypothetical protein